MENKKLEKEREAIIKVINELKERLAKVEQISPEDTRRKLDILHLLLELTHAVDCETFIKIRNNAELNQHNDMVEALMDREPIYNSVFDKEYDLKMEDKK